MQLGGFQGFANEETNYFLFAPPSSHPNRSFSRDLVKALHCIHDGALYARAHCMAIESALGHE